jgi:hypothetical protein
MKKTLIMYIALMATSLSFSQVGIGTTNPRATLDVNGNFKVGQYLSFSSTQDLLKEYVNLISNVHGDVLLSSNLYNSDTSNELFVAKSHPTMKGAAIRIKGNQSTDTGDIQFWTTPYGAATEDAPYSETIPTMLLKNNKNVGIGTSSPTRKLHIKDGGQYIEEGSLQISLANDVGGNLYLTNPSKVGPDAISTWTIFNMTGGYGDGLHFWRYADGNPNGSNGSMFSGPSVMFADNGNVGIGTISPSSKLQVTGAIATSITSIASNTTLNAAHSTVVCNTATAGFTVTLPAASSCTGREYTICRKDQNTTNVLSFSTPIYYPDGVTNFTTTNIPNAVFVLQSDGANWIVIK